MIRRSSTTWMLALAIGSILFLLGASTEAVGEMNAISLKISLVQSLLTFIVGLRGWLSCQSAFFVNMRVWGQFPGCMWKSQKWWVVCACNLAVTRQGWEDPGLAGQWTPSEHQANDVHLVSKEMVGSLSMWAKVVLWPPCMYILMNTHTRMLCTCMNTHVHLHEHIHAHEHTHHTCKEKFHGAS